MAFPDTSSGVFQFQLSAADGMLFKTELLSSIRRHCSAFSPFQIEATDSSLRFLSRNSLFHYEYQLAIGVEVNDGQTSVRYEFGTQYLVSYLFIAVLASLVFFKMNFGPFFFLTVALILLLYTIANAYIRTQVKQMLRACSPLFDEQSDVSPEMLRMQGEWAASSDVCPACGAKKTIFDRVCYHCGLKLNDAARPHPSNSTAKNHKRLNYLIKSKKK